MTKTTPNSSVSGTARWIEPLLNLTAIFILSTIFLAWNASRLVYILLSMAAFAYLLKIQLKLPSDQRFFSWPIIGFVGAAALSVWYHGWSGSGINFLVSRYFLLLLAIPLVGIFYVSFDPERNVWTKFALGSVVIGILALVDVLILDEHRAGGGHNSVVFGFIALAMITPLIASYHQWRNFKFGKYYFVIGILMGCCGMLLSETRSSWITAIALIIIAMMFYLDFYSITKRSLIILVLICCIAGIGMSIPVVNKRIGNMVEITAPYINGEEQRKFSSLRLRVEGWKASWNIGLDSYVLGIGLGVADYRKALRAYVEDKRELAPVAELKHTHNQFMHIFAMSGVVGLISFVGLIACHLWIFTKYLNGRYSMEVRSLALSGFMLVVGYTIMSIPEVPFYNKQWLIMYSLSSASIWGCLLGALRASRQEIGIQMGKKSVAQIADSDPC